MYKSFTCLDELFTHLAEEKNWTGAEVGLHNRYPIRFILFDNFTDFNEFVVNRPAGIYKYSIESLLDVDSPDEFLSYTELSREIRSFTKKIPANDFVIYPFSEMARFYDNSENMEFDALIKTIRGEQAPEDSQLEHVRVYIPIVGMQGKMGKFMNDNITFVWEYKSGVELGTYYLVITDGTTYGVNGLEDKYTVVNSLYEWLKLWEKGDEVKQTIICSSPNIFINAHFAQPDNAFEYHDCNNAYEFLTKGLHLDFGVTEKPSEEELVYWEQLASQIDINTFDFDEFVKERLDTFALTNGIDFIKSWFDCESDFDRWLLTLYFRNIADKQSYIYQVVAQCTKLTKSELFSDIATLIFDEINPDTYRWERLQALKIAAEHDVNITDMAKQKLSAKLSAIAASLDGGYYKAVNLLTPFTDEERQLAIKWVANGKVSLNEIQTIFPNLYSYMKPLELNSLGIENEWIKEYFSEYRWAKIKERTTEEVGNIINTRNASPVSFQNWIDNFKTVKTILYNRKDIDVFYWIDGLGVDWIPFIRDIISKYSTEHVYLNEILIGVADIPSTTSKNKEKLQSLVPSGQILPKIGDIDTFAHATKKFPQYIIDEMSIIEKAILKVLDDYNGKKIAFVSDHGLTYLSQFEEGLKLAGIDPDHEGRCAKIQGGSLISDNKYIILDDGKTVCSLTHHSLVNKVDRSHGAHGGCTPEEVLVPIIVVSSTKNSNAFSVNIENDEINGTDPCIKFCIKGLSSVDVPSLLYNGVEYMLFSVGNDIFQSERLNLVDTATKVSVYINKELYDTYSIKISTGAKEDDLFGEL